MNNTLGLNSENSYGKVICSNCQTEITRLIKENNFISIINVLIVKKFTF